MGAEIIAALIGAVASLGATGASIGATSKINKKNREWQEKMYDLAVKNNRQDAETTYGRQMGLIDYTTQNQLDYKTQEAGAIKEGYKNAGLNIGLALNGGIGGTQGVGATSAPQAQAASAGNPQTFMPNIMDISGAVKNIAEAKLASSEAKYKEGLTEKIADERKEIEARTAQYQKSIEEMDSRINLNDLLGSWQEIQNDIAKATKGEQIELKKYELKNTQAEYDKKVKEIQALDIENSKKEEMLNNLLKLQAAQINKTYLEALGQSIQNEKEFKSMQSFLNAAEATAVKLKAEAQNEKDFKARWYTEMKLKAKELKIKQFGEENGNIWRSFTSSYYALWQ